MGRWLSLYYLSNNSFYFKKRRVFIYFTRDLHKLISGVGKIAKVAFKLNRIEKNSRKVAFLLNIIE
jgi:hypothetical protein